MSRKRNTFMGVGLWLLLAVVAVGAPEPDDEAASWARIEALTQPVPVPPAGTDESIAQEQ
jgi:hypothetical protein